MPLTLNRRSTTSARVRAALLLRKKIDELERRFARTVANLPKNILARNVYGFSTGEMRKIAHNLHAKAKEEIASGHARKFRGSRPHDGSVVEKIHAPRWHYSARAA